MTSSSGSAGECGWLAVEHIRHIQDCSAVFRSCRRNLPPVIPCLRNQPILSHTVYNQLPNLYGVALPCCCPKSFDVVNSKYKECKTICSFTLSVNHIIGRGTYSVMGGGGGTHVMYTCMHGYGVVTSLAQVWHTRMVEPMLQRASSKSKILKV